jgi:hypothetical protein
MSRLEKDRTTASMAIMPITAGHDQILQPRGGVQDFRGLEIVEQRQAAQPYS